MATTTEAMPLPCGPYLQALLVRAAHALDASLIPDWDETGMRNLQGLRAGKWQPYWLSSKRRHLSRTDEMACAALIALATDTKGPDWGTEAAATAQLLASEISAGRCAVW
ncbi:hypothetical protein SSRP02_p015 [Synechococcus phage S-SRP02]|nr:hypothetical protein SSRP02_p015 [Synechococcus phage S-SRP02]